MRYIIFGSPYVTIHLKNDVSTDSEDESTHLLLTIVAEIRIISLARYGYRFRFADLAQLVEQLICNQQVNGSNPLIGSNSKSYSL